jgi:hypothetical protein
MKPGDKIRDKYESEILVKMMRKVTGTVYKVTVNRKGERTIHFVTEDNKLRTVNEKDVEII